MIPPVKPSSGGCSFPHLTDVPEWAAEGKGILPAPQLSVLRPWPLSCQKLSAGAGGTKPHSLLFSVTGLLATLLHSLRPVTPSSSPLPHSPPSQGTLASIVIPSYTLFLDIGISDPHLDTPLTTHSFGYPMDFVTTPSTILADHQNAPSLKVIFVL